MNDTEQKLKAYIEKTGMLSSGDLVITGVSGGADSVFLLLFLKKQFSELNLNGKTELVRTGFPQVGIVTSGSGKLSWNSGISKMEIKKGMEIFFPYNIPGLAAEGQLSLVLCNPEGAL